MLEKRGKEIEEASKKILRACVNEMNAQYDFHYCHDSIPMQYVSYGIRVCWNIDVVSASIQWSCCAALELVLDKYRRYVGTQPRKNIDIE